MIHFHRRGFFPLSKDIVKEIFLIDVKENPKRYSDSCIDQIVNLFFGQSSGSGIPGVYEEVFRSSLIARNWSLASALVRIRPTLPEFRGRSDYFNYARRALRCKMCLRLNGKCEEQGGQDIHGVYSIYKLCAVHIDKLDSTVLLWSRETLFGQ